MYVLDLEKYNVKPVSFYLAVEEFLMTKKIDCFFLWRMRKSIVIGKHQLLALEVNIKKANEQNVPIFRRPSGGGAIYADEGCFMYSFVTTMKNKEEITNKLLSSFHKALAQVGINATFSGRNDLLFENRKFSGTAFYQNANASCLHGTFLYDTDLQALVELLTPNEDKLKSKGISSVKQRVINLKEYTNLSQDKLMKEIEKYFFDQELVLTKDDIELINKYEEKYKSYDYINANPAYTFHNKIYNKSGLFEIFIDVKKNKISNISLKGDFFDKNNLEKLYNMFINQYMDNKVLEEIIKQITFSDYVYLTDEKDQNTLERLLLEDE